MLSDEWIDNRLPDWATEHFDGTLKPGVQLCTKDGRRIGNAVIVAEGDYYSIFKEWHLYTVVTDIGTMLKCSAEELTEMFHEPKYVMDFRKHNGYNAWQEDIRLGRD